MAAVRNRGNMRKTVSTEEQPTCFKEAAVVHSLSASSFHLLCRQIHKPRDSLLSQPGLLFSLKGFTSFILVLLVLFNLRLALYNISKSLRYFELGKWFLYVFADTKSIPPLMAIICLPAAACFSLYAEKKFAAREVATKTYTLMVMANIATLLCLPPLFLLPVQTNLPASVACIWFTIVVWLKLVSYHMVNAWSRGAQSKPKSKNMNGTIGPEEEREKATHTNGMPANGHIAKPVVYPDNLYAKDLWYFMFAPTLCYELNFPQRPKIRKMFLLMRSIEVIAIPLLAGTLLNQWGVPVLATVVKAYKKMDLWDFCKAYIDLLVWNTVFWGSMSFWLFHSGLNWLGELLRFADRDFYRDWWNADSVKAFWNRWNLPVHNWCLRHIYTPLVAMGFSKFLAQMAVFFVSAFFHEYIMSLPLKGLHGWAFIGMAIQLPLFHLYDNIIRKRCPNAGNTIVVVLFIFVMPAVVVLYYCEYYCIVIGEP